MLTNRIIPANHTTEFPFAIPTAQVLRYNFTATRPINLLVLDSIQRSAYREGRPYVSQDAISGQSAATGSIALPYIGTWFVLLRNIQDEAVTVDIKFAFETPSGPAGMLSGSIFR